MPKPGWLPGATKQEGSGHAQGQLPGEVGVGPGGRESGPSAYRWGELEDLREPQSPSWRVPLLLSGGLWAPRGQVMFLKVARNLDFYTV